VINALTVVGFGIPVAGCFWLVHRYSVNVVVQDQWSDVVVIGRSYSDLFDWNSLWALHNGNRIFFPNVVVLILARTTGFNIQIEEFVSATMLVTSTGLLIWAHKRRSPSIPWLYYCPVALLALSVVQYQNLLWGFQMAWYLVLLSLAAAIVLLDRPVLSNWWLVGAIAAGIVGSFSSLQGLLIWPIGLVLLYQRKRSPAIALAWLVAAVASFALYFYNFTVNDKYVGAWAHPLVAFKFFSFAIGDVVGLQLNPSPFPYSGYAAVRLLGLVIVVLAVGVLIAYGIRRDESGGTPIGVALVCAGLLFAVLVTNGRIVLGFQGASQSRYTTFDLLVPIGIYLSLLGRPFVGSSSQRFNAWSADHGHAEVRLGHGDSPFRDQTTWSRSRLLAARFLQAGARCAIGIVIALQLALGLHYGLEGARTNYGNNIEAARVLRNFNHEPDDQLIFYLDSFGSASFVREQARTLEDHHLSLFGGGRSP
jgi:hypothetical protein